MFILNAPSNCCNFLLLIWGTLLPAKGQIYHSSMFRGLGICTHMSVKVKVKSLSRVRLLVTLWTVAYQAPLSMEFSRQEYWSGLPFPSPGDFPNLGIEPRSPALQADTTIWATYICLINPFCKFRGVFIFFFLIFWVSWIFFKHFCFDSPFQSPAKLY